MITAFIATCALLSLGSVGQEGGVYNLPEKSTGFLFAQKEYPTGDFALSFDLEYREPGSIFDTAGLNSAENGAWSVLVMPDDLLALNIWDGSRWHTVLSVHKVPRNRVVPLKIVRKGGKVTLWIDGKPDESKPLAVPLSGKPFYVGDFKGDEQWGSSYRIHQSVLGKVSNLHFLKEGANPAVPAKGDPLNTEPMTQSFGEIRVEIPAQTVGSGLEITGGFVNALPAALPTEAQPIKTIQVSVLGQNRFPNAITIRVPVSVSEHPEWVRAAYYEPISKTWVMTPCRLEGGNAVIETNHLSIITLFLWNRWMYGVAKTEHFHITWRDARLKAEATRGDAAWAAKRRADTLDPIGVTKIPLTEGIPLYIHDLALALEYSYARYKDLGFAVPTWFRQDVVVGQMGEPFRETLTGVIWIPDAVNEPSALRKVAAHEFFHTVESRYLSVPGLVYRFWLAESCAEYASMNLVFPGSSGETKINPAFFRTSLAAREEPHVYESERFHDYLARNGLKFAPTFLETMRRTNSAADYLLMGWQVTESFADLSLGKQNPEIMRGMDIGSYERAVTGLKSWSFVHEGYAGWVAETLLNKDIPIAVSDTLLDSLAPTPIELGKSNPKISKIFEMGANYTADGLVVTKAKDEKVADVRIEVQQGMPEKSMVQAFLVKGRERVKGGSKPIATMCAWNDVRSAKLKMADGESLVLIATNSFKEPTRVRAIVSYEEVAATNDLFRLSQVTSKLELPSRFKVDQQQLESGRIFVAYVDPPLKGAGGVILVPGYSGKFTATWPGLEQTLKPGADIVLIVDAEITREPPKESKPAVYLMISTPRGPVPVSAEEQSQGAGKIRYKFTFRVPSVCAWMNIAVRGGAATVQYEYVSR